MNSASRTPASRQSSRGLGERGEQQAVPRGDDLVVARRLRPAFALLEQPRAQLGIELTADDGAPVLERLQQLLRNALVGGPRECEPFDAVRVRVLRRREAAVRQRELAEDVRERLLHDLAVALVA